MTDVLNLATQRLVNGLFVQASAGTGKTYSIAALIVREIALAGELDTTTNEVRPDLSIADILVTTFTRNAAADLRDRVRRRLVETARALRDGTDRDDVIVALLASGTPEQISDRIARISRAVVEFDAATISTIHSICSKIITLAGEAVEMDDEDVESGIIAEVVNDIMLDRRDSALIKADKVRTIVQKLVSEPNTTIWHDPAIPDDDRDLSVLVGAVNDAVTRVEERLRQTPSFSYLVNRARDILAVTSQDTVLAEFRRRYKYIVVDEAQDTDSLQWDIFRAVFPLEEAAHDGVLLAVGDPKQSIYKFRGADVDAYTIERDRGSVVSLSTNYRSDKAVIDGLNAFFDGASFGRGIDYQEVLHAPSKVQSGTTLDHAVEVIKCPGVTNAGDVATVAAQRVLDILHSGASIVVERPDGTADTRAILPSDVVVLVRTGATGLQIEKNLRRFDVPAVSTGTASVMQSESAEHWRVLLAALERISDAGRVRHLLCTPLFGVPLTSPAMRDDSFLSTMQDRLFAFVSILRRDGVAALTATIMSDPSTVIAMSRGEVGERRLTDFAHVADLLHAETGGVGCTPADALEVHGNLLKVDATSETVSRRVESDADAVQVMTIHVSKGLEFPIVVVADTWGTQDSQATRNVPVVRLADDDGAGTERRVIDIGWALDRTSPAITAQLERDFVDDLGRLLYVAATRAQHHVSILQADFKNGNVIDRIVNADVLAGKNPFVHVRAADSLRKPKSWTAPDQGTRAATSVSAIERDILQTHVRTSFTGILALQRGSSLSWATEHVAGKEEGSGISGQRPRPAGAHVPDSINAALVLPMARIPGGTSIGSLLHLIYEDVDPSHDQLEEHVTDVVARHATGRFHDAHGPSIVEGVLASLRTPLGPLLGDRTLIDLGARNRAAELGFEMSMASMTAGVLVSDIGCVVHAMVPPGDILSGYAKTLTDPSFDIGLGGLINGSIDALVRIPTSNGREALVVSDYKSNRLDREGDAALIDGYSQKRMLEEMIHHHYPLQAMIYCTAVHRMIRSRRPAWSADDLEQAVPGFAYLFVRGMVGAGAPRDEKGHRHGVFSWTPPKGLWSRLSDLLAGDRP